MPETGSVAQCEVFDIPDNIVVKYLKREAGLPSGQIQDLAEGNDGRLWAATPSGLASFDGSRVLVFARNEGLQTHGLRAVAVAPDNRIWVGSDAGYDVLDGTSVTASSADEDWQHGFVECIHCARDSVWLGTAFGLLRHDGSTYKPADHQLLQGVMIAAIGSTSDGVLWVLTADDQLLYRAGDSWHRPEKSDWQAVGRLQCFASGLHEQLWLGGSAGFVEVTQTGEVPAQRQGAGDSGKVSALLFHNGELWVAENKSLNVYRRAEGNWRHERTVLTGHLINKIHIDRFDNVWVATESHGLAKISALNNSIRQLPLGDEQAIFSIKPGRNDGEVIAAGDRASWVVDTGRFFKAHEQVELAEQQVWDVVALQDGSLLAATATGLIFVDADGGKRIIGNNDPVVSRPNRCLLQHDDSVYVGTLGGCAIIQPDLSISPQLTVDNEPIGYVYTLARDSRRRIWAGTLGNGLWVKEDREFRRFEHELLSETGNTYAIDVRDDGVIAFVQDNRVFLIRPPRDELVELARSDEPIAGWTVRWAPDGTIWTGSASGLSQYNSEDGRRMRQIVALLGVSNWEFTTSRSLYVLGDGSFLCGVNSGLLFVSASLLQQKIQAPPIKPGRILWDKVEPELDGDRHVVMFGRWSVTIEVFAAWYVDEDDLEFRFRLQGLDEGWRDRGRRSSIRLDSLPPGDYQLEAQTFNRLAGFGPVETIIKLQVRNPRWANKLLIAPFAAAGKVWRISEALFRNRALLERNVELEREVQARTADIEQAKSLLEAMNKELASQTVTDALTGISNRRHFDERFEQDLHEASRTGEPLSLILIDIDHFKPYNDLYGHAQGDKCLSYVARKLESTLYRPNDLVARYGGEEFVVVLPNVDRQGAVLTAERLRNSIVSLAMAHDGAPGSKRVTISLGATTLQTPLGLQVTDVVATRLIECADAALYEAKETGRNRYVFRSAPDFGL